MNPVPSADNNDSRLVNPAPLQDSTISDISGVTNTNLQRYTSSELYLLRNDILSRRRPECTLRAELMSLSIWKPINAVSVYQQNINGNIGGNNSNNGSGNSNITSVISHLNTRGQRSPCRRNNILTESSSSQFVTHMHSTHTSQKNYVDHRSTSSAHLMPAFAKRRIGVSALVSSSLYDSSGKAASEIPSNAYAEIGNDFQQSCRQRSKEKIHDRQRINEDHLTTAYSSPQRINLGDFDKDRSESTHSGTVSPCTSSAFTSTRHSVVNSGNERRIGSGRLLHCDVNWDFRNADKDNKKSCSLVDKDSTAIHQRTSARFNDRERDRPERLNFTEKRHFDRKHTDVESRDKFESRNSAVHSNASISRRFLPNEIESKSNCMEIPEQHSAQSMRSRHHYYNEIKDEPEWFSGGPTSQHDTIELRGFDDLDEQSRLMDNNNLQRKLSESSSRASSITNLFSSKLKDPPEDNITEKGSDVSAVFVKSKGGYAKDSVIMTNNQQKIDVLVKNDKNSSNGQQFFKSNLNSENEEVKCDKKKNDFQFGLSDFNFDAFLNMDPLTHSLMGINVKQDEELGIIGSSRFSRWFGSKNNLPDSTNRTMPQQTEKKIKSNDSCGIKISEKDSMLSTPVSNESQKPANTLMQFLQRSKLPSTLEGVQSHGCIPSVEELEARMRKIRSAPESNTFKENKPSSCNAQNAGVQLSEIVINSQVPITQQDTEAFKKLLEQLGSANKTDHQDSHTAIELQKENKEQRSSLNISQNNVINNFSMPQNEEINKLIQHQLVHQQQQPHSQSLQNQQSNLHQPQNDSFVGIASYIPNVAYEKSRYELNLLQGMPCARDTQFCAQNIQNSALKKKLEDHESFKRRQEIQKHSSLQNAIPSGPKSSVDTEISQKSFHHHHQQLKPSNGLCQQLSPQNPQCLQTSGPQHFSANPPQSQHQRVINSPTPLAFTPTSVLRKMTAEKENSSIIPTTPHQQAANQLHLANSILPLRQHLQIHTQTTNKNMQSVLLNQQQHQHQPQLISQQSHHQVSIINPQQQTPHPPRMILGGNSHPQQTQLNNQQMSPQQTLQQQPHSLGGITQRLRSNQQQLKWQVPPILNQQQIPPNKSIGRPILKGPAQSQQKQQQQSPSMAYESKIEFQQIQQQQQQKLKINPNIQNVHQQQFSITHQAPQTNIMTQVQQHLFQQQQQQRAAALQRAQHVQLQQMHQQQQHLNRQIGSNQAQCAPGRSTSTGNTGLINYQRDGGLSPTSNQLAQWFSPELLAQASAGKLPLLNMNQALSLEEFERSIQHSSTAVHN